MSCKLLQRTAKHQLSVINCNTFYRAFSASTNAHNNVYIVPTYEQLQEYTKNIASVLPSWPVQVRDYFIATLHKAQANPKRNKNYNHLLNNNKIPVEYLQSLDIDKLQQWLPFIYVTDIIQSMDDIMQSPTLASIRDGNQLISYNDNNPHHQQILRRIKAEHYDKMIWIRDIPMNVTDIKLAQIFSKFGEISGITMDRYQSGKQQQWIQHKQMELKQHQMDELNKTIQKLRDTMQTNLINEYLQQYLQIELDIDNKYDILRLIMAHLQHQYDITDSKLKDNQLLLVPVCLDHSVSDILCDFQDANPNYTFYHENGNIIIRTTSDQESMLRKKLNEHRLIENVRRSSSKDGMIEMEITFVSKVESSIKDFVIALCTSYYHIDASKVSISHHIPYRIPSWWRKMHTETEHEFFSCTMEDPDHFSISQRINKVSSEGDEELAKVLESTQAATCNAFVYFKDIEPINKIICKQTKIWGMVINGQRCQVSAAPTQILLNNVPYDPWNPIRHTPLYTQSTEHIDNAIRDTEYDDTGNVIPPLSTRCIQREKSHIPIGSEHIQCSVPFVQNNNVDCRGLEAVYTQTTKFKHDFSLDSLIARLEQEAPEKDIIGASIAERTHLLMKHSNTMNIGLPLNGGVIQYMLALIPVNDHNEDGLNKFYDGDSFTAPYKMDETNDILQIKHMPIVANKAKIHINDSWMDNRLQGNNCYIWKHASCTFEDKQLMWYIDDDVNRHTVKQKKVKNSIGIDKLFVRMGYICVHSKRHRKVSIISHGIRTWDGDTPDVLRTMDGHDSIIDILEELNDWLDDDIDDNQSKTIAKSVKSNHNNISEMNVFEAQKETSKERKESKRTFDLDRGQQTWVYVNGIKHNFGNDEEAMILHKGWNHILIDFGFNDMNNASFQIIDFNEKSEIHDLSWRYSPPPMSLILKFKDHIHAMEKYDKLKTAHQKRYGVRVQMCNYDDTYLGNEAILQSESIDEDADEDEDVDVNDDIYSHFINDLNINVNGNQYSNDGLETFANEMVQNIHESHKKFDYNKTVSKTVYDDTTNYNKILADYSPCQMLQYHEDSTYSNTTELLNTTLNVPSTLELLDGE